MISNGLVAWFPFTDGSINDASGNGHNCSNTGVTFGVDRVGRPNHSANFDGSGTILTSDAFNPQNNGEMSCSVWVNMRGVTTQNSVQYVSYVVAKGNDAAGNSWGICIAAPSSNPDTSRLVASFLVYGPTTPSWANSPEGMINIGQWHHIVGLMKNGAVYIWVDGLPVGSASGFGSLGASANAVTIGRQIRPNYEYRLNGLVEDVRIYNRCLTDHEIRMLYCGKRSYGYVDLFNSCVSYYDFRNTTPTFVPDLVGVNNGAVGGATRTSDRHGRDGGAFSFSRGNNYIDCGSDSSLGVSFPITVSAVVRIRSYSADGNVGQIITNQYSGGQGYIFSLTGPGAAYPELRLHAPTSKPEGIHYARSPESISLNVWYDITGTFDGNYAKIYVNGVLKKTTNIVGCGSANALWIGRAIFGPTASDLQLDGDIMNFGFWSRVLTDAEVMALCTIRKNKDFYPVVR